MQSSNFICTVRPSNNSVERIERMIYKGMSVARLNFSHGTQDEHQETIKNLRMAAKRCHERNNYHWSVAIAGDLCGPELRTEKIEKPGKSVDVGELVKFNDNPMFAENSSSEMIHIDRPIADFVKKNYLMFIDDGTVKLIVEDIFSYVITCRVIKKGILVSNQSIFIPEIMKSLNLPVVSEKDKMNLKFAVEHDIDFIFASHVERGEWIDDIRKVLKDFGGEKIKIYAKIQNRFGVDEMEEIVAKADGIVFSPTNDIAPIKIPMIQQMLLVLCKKKMKLCFIKIDSEMFPSEIYQAVNWFMEFGDGTVMTRCSSEGKTKPLESMTILKNIRKFLAEEPRDFNFNVSKATSDVNSESLASAAVLSAFTTNSSAIIITSESEEFVHLVYFYQPKCEIIVVMKNPKTCRQLNILDKVTPLIYESANKKSKVDHATKFAKSRGIIKGGDAVVVLKYEESIMEIHYIQYEV